MDILSSLQKVSVDLAVDELMRGIKQNKPGYKEQLAKYIEKCPEDQLIKIWETAVQYHFLKSHSIEKAILGRMKDPKVIEEFLTIPEYWEHNADLLTHLHIPTKIFKNFVLQEPEVISHNVDAFNRVFYTVLHNDSKLAQELFTHVKSDKIMSMLISYCPTEFLRHVVEGTIKAHPGIKTKAQEVLDSDDSFIWGRDSQRTR